MMLPDCLLGIGVDIVQAEYSIQGGVQEVRLLLDSKLELKDMPYNRSMFL
jgi:hypothetical protein